MVHLDFQNLLDTVDHEISLRKFHYYEIKERNAFNCIRGSKLQTV